MLLGFLLTLQIEGTSLAVNDLAATDVFCGASGSEMDEAVAEYAAAKDKLTMGFTKEGATLLRGLLQRRPWFVIARWALARTEEERGAMIAAYGEYKRLLRAPIQQEDKEDTRRHIRALEAKSEPLAAYAQAELAADQKDWAGAAALAARVIEQKPNFALAHRLLGIAHANTGRIADAAKAYRTYLSTSEQSDERHSIEEFLKDFDAGAFAK